MAPRKPKEKKVLPDFPQPTSEYKLNQGFHYGMGDHPPQYGQIPVPEGRIGCLDGINFVATGTMPSLLREELKDIIEKYGGKLTGNISGRTDVVVRGVIEVGPKKIQEARDRKVTIIDQYGLFDVIARSNPDYKEAKEEEKKADEEKEDIAPDLPLSLIEYPQSTLFTEKYRPRKPSQLVGNIGPISQLKNWLNEFPKVPKKITLVSGPAGIGKTTAVSLSCLECGYTTVDYNATIQRSKKTLQEILNTSTTLVQADGKVLRKTAIIIDEIDGFSGTSDKGGIQYIASQAKDTKVPIICICGSPDEQKLAPLQEVSLPVQFSPISSKDIISRLSQICKQEEIELSDSILEEIAKTCDGDLRSAINSLQFWSGDGESVKTIEKSDTLAATLTIFNSSSLDDKIDAFFVDYGRIPQYVEENLPFTNRHNWAKSLDYISEGDTINKTMMIDQNYSLLNAQAICSAILPASYKDPETKVESLLVPKMYKKSRVQDKNYKCTIDISSRMSRSCKINRAEVYDTLSTMLSIYLAKIINKDDANAMVDALDSLELTYDDYESLRNIASFDLKLIPKLSKTEESAVKKVVKSKHSESKKSTSEADRRAEYGFVKLKVESTKSKSKDKDKKEDKKTKAKKEDAKAKKGGKENPKTRKKKS